MGRPLNSGLIAAYAASFNKYPILKSRGFSILVNTSGKLFTSTKPSLKDVDANTEDCSGKNGLVWKYLLEYVLECFGICFIYYKICVVMVSCAIMCCSTLKVIESVMEVCCGKGRFSAHLLSQAVSKFFTDQSLFPKGMCADMECVENWSLRCGQTIQRLETWRIFRGYLMDMSQNEVSVFGSKIATLRGKMDTSFWDISIYKILDLLAIALYVYIYRDLYIHIYMCISICIYICTYIYRYCLFLFPCFLLYMSGKNHGYIL